ncbi:MAG: helix-turn-helix transcriptional regulator [Planctomycetes bacterium]|nr:helix-turn-helix transcriptional regulator [Planctomycetota bacterium]
MAGYDTLAGRLRIALKARGLSGAAFARECGMTKQNFQRFLSGDIQRSKHLPALARALGVELPWLAMGDPHTAPPWCTEAVAVPSITNLTDTHPEAKPLAPGPSTWKTTWRTRTMRGTGGRPLAEDGDRLIIDTEQQPAPGHLLLIPSAGKLFLKRHGGFHGNHVLLAGVDRGFFQEAVRVSRIRDAHVVVGVVFAAAPLVG